MALECVKSHDCDQCEGHLVECKRAAETVHVMGQSDNQLGYIFVPIQRSPLISRSDQRQVALAASRISGESSARQAGLGLLQKIKDEV